MVFGRGVDHHIHVWTRPREGDCACKTLPALDAAFSLPLFDLSLPLDAVSTNYACTHLIAAQMNSFTSVDFAPTRWP